MISFNRYMISDLFASSWHDLRNQFGHTFTYQFISRITTRQCDGSSNPVQSNQTLITRLFLNNYSFTLHIIINLHLDQHFLRSIAPQSKATEIIYPPSLKVYLAKEQLESFVECTHNQPKRLSFSLYLFLIDLFIISISHWFIHYIYIYD